jgi:hypothetical protein
VLSVCAAFVSACTGDSGGSCGVGDGPVGHGQGYATPELALHAVLARHFRWLAQSGWVAHRDNRSLVTYTSGNDQVDVASNRSGQWFPTGVTACS